MERTHYRPRPPIVGRNSRGLVVVWLNERTTSSGGSGLRQEVHFLRSKDYVPGAPIRWFGSQGQTKRDHCICFTFSGGESTWRQEVLESNSKNGINELQESVSGLPDFSGALFALCLQ
jgi:hypothetical protein